MEQLEKKGAPASGENAGEAGKKPKPYFTVRVNKWLFAVALLIALVLLVRHFYLVRDSNYNTGLKMGWHLEQFALELSTLEKSLQEPMKISETDLRALYVASQVVSWDFKDSTGAFYFGSACNYHRMHGILRLRQKQGWTDEEQRAADEFIRILSEMRERLMDLAEQAYAGKWKGIDIDPVIELNRKLDYTAWHFVEHNRLPGDQTLPDQAMENRIRAIPGWENAQITITPREWQDTEYYSGYNRATVEANGDSVDIVYSAYTGDIDSVTIAFTEESIDAEQTAGELVQKLFGPDFSVTMLPWHGQSPHRITFHYKGVEIARKGYDHPVMRVSYSYDKKDNKLLLEDIPPLATIAEAELTPLLTEEQAREIVNETGDPVELLSLHHDLPRETGLVLLYSARSGRYVVAYQFNERGYVNAVTGEREASYSNYYVDFVAFPNTPVGHMNR